jgi:membrane peptidoglycan carboxypeptidase
MASGILGIGVTGLSAAQAGIRTTENNIGNVNTAGYHRQDTVFATQTPSFTGAGWFGNGVAIESVRRQYSQFLDKEVLLDQAQLSRHETYAAQASQVDALLGDDNSGLSASLDAFFNAVNEVIPPRPPRARPCSPAGTISPAASTISTTRCNRNWPTATRPSPACPPGSIPTPARSPP